MNVTRKTIRAALTSSTMAFIAFLAIVGGAYASYTIYSNLVTVTVTDYSLSLSESHNGLMVTLDGSLLNPSGNPIPGASVALYRCDSSGAILETVTTLTTNSTGQFSHVWTAPLAGNYYFKASYLVT